MPTRPKTFGHRPKPRPSAAKRGYGRTWQRESKQHLMANPWCFYCSQKGMVVLATCVDHAIPHKGDHVAFWDKGNWRSSCKTCHDTKTATQDGGFGR